MLFRFSSWAIPAFLLSSCAFGQTVQATAISAPSAAVETESTADSAEPKAPEIKADMTDPAVVRAQQNANRVRGLVQQGILPANDFLRAQDDLNDAIDDSILRAGSFNQNLEPDQASQLVTVAQRMFLRRQRRSSQIRALAANGVLSRAEAEMASVDVGNAKLQLDLAIQRASLIKEMAYQKSLIEVETDAESHPEWNGQQYIRFDGNGTFTRAQFDSISVAYQIAFGKAIPVSADGQTTTHKAMGFNHTGRIDIALNPDQREGVWLMKYLEKNKIPYYAFKNAIAHKATGPHIHLGPGSTRLTATTKSCCGS